MATKPCGQLLWRHLGGDVPHLETLGVATKLCRPPARNHLGASETILKPLGTWVLTILLERQLGWLLAATLEPPGC